MKLSSYLPRQAENDLSKLIESDQIQCKEGYVGCCKKYFLIFPNDNHKYYYNPNKLISDSLKKKVFKYLYSPTNNMSKRLNKKQQLKILIMMIILEKPKNGLRRTHQILNKKTTKFRWCMI